MNARLAISRVRAMTLIEVLAATAMLAFIASALIGLGSAVITPDRDGSISNQPEKSQRLAELRAFKVDDLQARLNPGERLLRVESENPDPDKPSRGAWVTVSTEYGLVVRWLPTPEAEDTALEDAR